ncbi:MAG: type II secretion system protein [Thiotrichales bacterium]|nr:type II secretion system protein [Thiotrichales bacterium]
MKIYKTHSTQAGFSLLELSIALTIIGFLIYGVSGALNSIEEFDEYAENRVFMEEVHDGFLTFVQVNRFLPCPDTDNPPDGRENRELAGECSGEEGRVPFLDLGVKSTDVWDNPLYYAVNNTADSAAVLDANSSASYFNALTAPLAAFDYETPPFGSNDGAGNYTVCNETASACSGSTSSANVIEFSAVAVVISFGQNGAQTWAGNPDGDAEVENADDDNYFWQGQGSNVEGQKFDDQLFWLTGYDIKYAVIRSGADLPEIP